MNYQTKFFSFLDKFLYLFLERNPHFYNQKVAGYYELMIVIMKITAVLYQDSVVRPMPIRDHYSE